MTKTMIFVSTLTLTLVAAAPGCKKKDAAGGAAAGSGDTAKPSNDKSAAPKTPCPANATKNAAGGFCVVIPTTAHENPMKEMGKDLKDYNYSEDGGNHSVSVEVGKYGGDQKAFDNNVDVMQHMVNTPDKKNWTAVDVPGGKFWSYQDGDGVWGHSMIHDDKQTYECHTRESPTDSSPEVPMVMAACKTILPL
jgi:hypothetical protein